MSVQDRRAERERADLVSLLPQAAPGRHLTRRSIKDFAEGFAVARMIRWMFGQWF